jgi:hypothetical protein
MSIRAAFPILRISGVCGEAGALSPPRGVPGIRRFPVVVSVKRVWVRLGALGALRVLGALGSVWERWEHWER